MKEWSAQHSAELYGLGLWGENCFDVSAAGDVIVKKSDSGNRGCISIADTVKNLARRGLNLPMLLRFDDILDARIKRLHRCFSSAISETAYNGRYHAVYPIKVNQKQQVLKDIIEFGQPFSHGLEAGSKAELLAAIAHISGNNSMIVCNGYKDQEFIDLALYATSLGLRVFIVVEMPAELLAIINRSKQLGIQPDLGIRVKLSSTSGGHWDKSSGDEGKFGMTASQIIEAVEKLRSSQMLSALKMLHYHIGSQVSDITRIRTALKEAIRFYAEMTRMGAPMQVINVGGGLAVDYTGAKANEPESRNYSLREYAADIVDIIKSVSETAGIEHPDIVSESGRATVASHSVLVFNVLHTRSFRPLQLNEYPSFRCSPPTESLCEAFQYIKPGHLQEAFNDAVYYRDQVREQFVLGEISIEEKAYAEDTFWNIIQKISAASGEQEYVPKALRKLEAALPDVYYGNFSLFQSLPDSWAIDQVFPVMPIHRLHEEPKRNAVIADITCDSDGILNRFAMAGRLSSTLKLHELNDEEYYLGIFLVGAYQETLGDLHNLLGEINVVHVSADKDGKVTYNRELPGASAGAVLEDVGYNRDRVENRLRALVDTAETNRHIGKDTIMNAFIEALDGYTYFER